MKKLFMAALVLLIGSQSLLMGGCGCGKPKTKTTVECTDCHR